MKNGKLFGMALVTSLVAVFALGYFMFFKNTEVQATGILFEGGNVFHYVKAANY